MRRGLSSLDNRGPVFQLRHDLEDGGRALDISGGEQAQDEQHQEDYDEDEEENASDIGAGSCNSAKAKNCCDHRDYKKYQSPFK